MSLLISFAKTGFSFLVNYNNKISLNFIVIKRRYSTHKPTAWKVVNDPLAITFILESSIIVCRHVTN
jgi:hypothetical protein